MSAPDESPRVSAAVGREDAVRHHLAPNPVSSRLVLVMPCRSCLSTVFCVARHPLYTVRRQDVKLSSARTASRHGGPRRDGGTMNRRVPCCFSRYARIVARTAFAVVNNIYCITPYVVWLMALRLIRPLFAPLYWKLEGLLFHWLLAMVSMWSWTAGYESKSLLIFCREAIVP